MKYHYFTKNIKQAAVIGYCVLAIMFHDQIDKKFKVLKHKQKLSKEKVNQLTMNAHYVNMKMLYVSIFVMLLCFTLGAQEYSKERIIPPNLIAESFNI